MRDFWKESDENKIKFINEIIKNGNSFDSLSNDVFIYENVVIKINNSESDKKMNNEKMFLNLLSRKHFSYKNILAIELIQGSINHFNSEVNQEEVLMIKKEKEDINDLFAPSIQKFDFAEKVERNIKILDTFIEENKISKINWTWIINVLKNEDDYVVSHCDLNVGNILFEKNKIHFIDFEESAITHKLFDWSTYIINRNFNRKSISNLSTEVCLGFEELIVTSIIQGILMKKWNDKQFIITGNNKYKTKASELTHKILELDLLKK